MASFVLIFVGGKELRSGVLFLLRDLCLVEVSNEGLSGLPWHDIRYIDAVGSDGTLRSKVFVSVKNRRRAQVGVRISTSDTENTRAFQQALGHYWPDWQKPWKQQLANRAG